MDYEITEILFKAITWKTTQAIFESNLKLIY
jgi:hypothetical protein